MKKRAAGFIVALLFILMLPTTSSATQMRALRPSVSLRFEGTTAHCSAIVTDIGKDLNVNMELWNGDVLVNSWPASGVGSVAVEGSCQVVKGQTYTLVVTGTTNGKSFSSTPFSRTC